MVQMFFALFVLGSVATIPPAAGYALQDYLELCSRPLMSNDTPVVRISSGLLCNISNGSYIAITGSSNTTVRCEGEGAVFEFMSAQQLTIEGITFINCGINFASIENVLITNCTFKDSSNRAIWSQSRNISVSITNCTFQNNNINITNGYGGGGAVLFDGSTGEVSISNCLFQDNSVTNTYGGGGGGAVFFEGSTGEVSISNCLFQNNSVTNTYGGGGGAAFFEGSTGEVSISNCLFQNNSVTNTYDGGGGGAVFLYYSTSEVSISNCLFHSNSVTITTYGGGGAVSGLGLRIFSITNCTFLSNSATVAPSGDGALGGGGGAVLLYDHDDSTGEANIENCTFQNNRATVEVGGGGGVGMIEFTGKVSISDCTFQSNSATTGVSGGAVSGGGGAVFLFLTGGVSITNNKFQYNSAVNGGGGGVLLYGIIGDVSFIRCTFENNVALYAGAVSWISVQGDIRVQNILLVVEPEATGNITISECLFQNNSAIIGGGAVFAWFGMLSNIQNNNMTLTGPTGYLSITYSTFQNNSATIGGAIYIISISSILINGSNFTNNAAEGGAAVYAINSYIPMIVFISSFLTSDTEPLGNLTLQDVIVEDNHCSCNDYNETMGGAIYFSGMMVDIIGNAITGSQFSSNYPLGAIQGINGFLQLHGNISFTNNTGVNGGAISLSNNVPLYFYEKCDVKFSRNLATGFGGAIYNNGDTGELTQPASNLKKCSIRLKKACTDDCAFNTSMFSITFTANHAQQGGHAVYATPIYKCTYWIGVLSTGDFITASSKSQNLTGYFNTTPLPEDANDIQVLSFPAYVQLCNCSDPTLLCSITSQFEGKVTTYPGSTVGLNVTSVDDGGSPSPSVIYTLIDTKGITSQNITLGPTQKAQWIGTRCSTIEYQIYGPVMASAKLLLSSYPTNFPTLVEVQLLPCEPGFTLMNSSSTGGMECGCSKFLIDHGVVCDPSDGNVTRNKNNWIGVYNNTDPALASTCPLDYCNNDIRKLPLARPGFLCNGGRTGIICGQCHGNHSVVFGSYECRVCSNMWLITLMMFAVLGVLLVAALFLFNLTVTQGTLYGLIFYANIIQVNTSIFFSQSNLRPLQVIVSFVNLDLGLPLCFYDGMDDADKAGLQFVFPAYLLILTMTVIVLCHYCLQRSPTSSSISCFHRLPIIIGERAVGVLSTLIYLSYSKLLRTVIDIFTLSTVHLERGDMYVWRNDGNVEYLHGKHTKIFVVAMVTCTLFLLPYTFALTFIPIIERYSEHNRLFNCLQKKTNQIKPMIDAHYAPYKGEWRWWLGARLWLLVVMYILNPVLTSDKPSLLLSIQATMVILFMLVQARMDPFGQPLQTTDKNRSINFYNQWYNCLDLFYLLNYTALALSMSYILDQSSDENKWTAVPVGVLVGLYVVVSMATVLYHLIVVILKACKMFRQKFERNCKLQVPTELHDVSSTKTVSTETAPAVIFALREPLLCED